MGCSSLFTHVLSLLKSKVPCSLHITFFCYSSPCCYIRRYILLRGIEVRLVRIIWPKMASHELLYFALWLFANQSSNSVKVGIAMRIIVDHFLCVLEGFQLRKPCC